MSDPQDELGARFDERRPDSDSADTGEASSTDNTGDAGNTDGTGNAGDTGSTDDTSSKPGPEPDADATRNRRQVPMYLSDEKADVLNGLYERLDGRSKVAGEGGIEKHADFMMELVDLAVDHEDELAERLGIGAE